MGNFSAWVKDNEPDTTEYELRKQVNSKTGVTSLFMIERYVKCFLAFVDTKVDLIFDFDLRHHSLLSKSLWKTPPFLLDSEYIVRLDKNVQLIGVQL